MLDRFDRASAVTGREAAAAAGLRYTVPYEDPGLTRRRAGKGFVYLDARGRRVCAPATLARIRRLVIPPAWEDVWIARDPRAHIQAVGRDARGRAQYRYHDRWRVARDAAKYERLPELCRALPRLHRRLERDLRCECVCRTSVAATVVALLERGHLRVGNDEYARENGTYGATTLEGRHLRLRGASIDLTFRGKSGVIRHVHLEDRVLARVLDRVRALPGRRLFQYVDDDTGRPRPISSDDVNAYLHDALGPGFSAKDFRTWGATVWCALRLAGEERPASERAARRVVTAVIREVAARLGHTPTVCRKSYIHPRVLEGWLRGDLSEAFPPRLRGATEFDVETLRLAERCVADVLDGARRRAQRRA